MPIVKQLVSATRTAATPTGLDGLATGTYSQAALINVSADDPSDILLDVNVKTAAGTLASNRQCVVFAKSSADNTNFSSGPENTTTTTDEPDLFLIGVIPVNTAATDHRRVFSVAAAFGGVLPPYIKLIIKNETGLALDATAGVNTAHYHIVQIST